MRGKLGQRAFAKIDLARYVAGTMSETYFIGTFQTSIIFA